MTNSPGPESVDQVRTAVREATHALLGATIQVSDEAWSAPSALPAWTRAELAAHLARHADALRGVVEGALRGEAVPLYPSPEAREAGIRAGAGRTGLAIQEDLDTAAGRLEAAFDAVEDWSAPVDFRGRSLPLALLLNGRLGEVVIHHVDLAIGQGFADIDPVTAGLVLDWLLPSLSTRPGAVPLRLVADDGRTWTSTVDGEPTEVTGTAPHLLGWLSGRLGPEIVTGASDVALPSW